MEQFLLFNLGLGVGLLISLIAFMVILKVHRRQGCVDIILPPDLWLNLRRFLIEKQLAKGRILGDRLILDGITAKLSD